MHMAIAIVVEGESADEALHTGRHTVENYIVTEGGFFDYDHDITLDGKEITGVVDIDDVKVKTALSNMIEYQKRDFLDACGKLRKILEDRSDEQLYDDNDRIASEFWYNAHQVSERVGGTFRVFDQDAEPFLKMEDIERFAEGNAKNGIKTFVYFRGVHF